MQALILDSNAADSGSLVDCLGRAGHVAVVATSVHQARQALMCQRFDVILLESTLPDGDGLSLCNEIRSQFGDELLIIFVCKINSPARRMAGLQLGADDYVGKSCSCDELLARIEAHFRRRQQGHALHVGH